MVWAIVLFVVAALLFIGAGAIFAQGTDKGAGIMLLPPGIVAGFLGGATLYVSALGNICRPRDMPNQIYTVAGQVTVTGGTVALIEDSEQTAYAVWARQNDEPELRPNVKFVKIGKSGYKACLVPVYGSEGSGVTIPNPLTEKPVAK